MDLQESEGTFSPSQKKWITVTKVIIFILGSMLLILCAWNVYNYLIKQNKYKQITLSLFYVTAFVSIGLIIIYSLFVPYDNYCKWNWMLLLYGISYSNLILGLCQAGTLTSLAVQLRCLFKY